VLATRLHIKGAVKAQSFYRRIMLETDRESLVDARRVTGVVLRALRDRLTPEEAADAAAQLPGELQALWLGGELAGRRPVKMHRSDFYDRVRSEAHLSSLREARAITHAVFAALKEQLSPGEADDILAQLPKDLKTVWEEA